MFPSILHDAKGPLIHLSCVLGTPPLVISLCLCLSCGEAAASTFFQEWVFLFNKKKSWRFWMRCASGMWALWEQQHHPQTQTTAIDFSVNSTKKTKRNNSNTKKSCLLNNSLFQSVDTALTKYSTLRIVHIGRTEEGRQDLWTGFSLASLESALLKKTNPKG